MDADEVKENAAIRVQLTKLIEDWNANRLDLFALSEPNEGILKFTYRYIQQAKPVNLKIYYEAVRSLKMYHKFEQDESVIPARRCPFVEKMTSSFEVMPRFEHLSRASCANFWQTAVSKIGMQELEFHGVMRFYFQESGQRMATKCIRVSSTATTRAVIEALIEKFHADLRLLSTPNYSLWEVHENGEKRKLLPDEKPLLVQLNWHKDDREGRFLLQGERDLAGAVDHLLQLPIDGDNNVAMKRKLSKREKRELKKLERQKQLAQAREAEDVTDLLYVEVPNTNFTRTISNPEVVMKKRRERKLEQKLKELGEGGSLKIYGEELSETKPYVTLLLALRDRADKVIRETLEKYGLGRHSANKFCLVEVRTLPDGQIEERVLDKDDCPLLILAREGSNGDPTFHVRLRGSRILSTASKSHAPSEHEVQAVETLPYLLEINPDGSEPAGASRVFVIRPNVTEIGCDRNFNNPNAQALCLYGPFVLPRHCVIALMDGVATLTPCEVGAEISVDARPISETAILRDGCLVCIGRTHLFRFHEKGGEKMSSVQPELLMKPISNSKTSTSVGLSPTTSHLSVAHEQTLSSHRTVGDSIPAVFEFNDSAAEDLLNAVIRSVDPTKLGFKLASAYTLYMCSRYCVSRELSSTMCKLLSKAAEMMLITIQDNRYNASMLAYWMSNAAETLNFIKLDVDVSSKTSPEPQESIADAVQKAFDHLAACLKRDLHAAMPPLLDPQASDAVAVEPCRHILNCVMNLLRLSRVNAALTIQLFSQLFHYINMYLFNWLVSREGATYCRQSWGKRLKARLSHLLNWAEQQGLELAAECRLERVLQAVHLLEATKTLNHLDAIGAHLTKLNSIQVAHLLECYTVESNEELIDRQFVELLIQIAERQVDQVLKNDFQPLQLEEEIDLLLPFLIPDDGYSSEMMRGVPAGLQEYADGLFQQGVGKLVMQPTSSGSWSVHFVNNSIAAAAGGGSDSETVATKRPTEASRPPLVYVSFEKDNNGIGLSIVHAQGSDEQMPGIYVKKVVPGSAAAKDGRLQAGDQLVAVNGQNLVGVTQEYAAKLMSQSGPVVNFEVAKGAALYNGLAQWIYQFSPEAGRSSGAGKGLSPAQGQGGRGYGMPYVESPAASPMRFKKSAGIRSPATSPSHVMSRSSVGLQQQQQQPARAAGTSTHRYSTSDIYHNVQNNRHVVQTVKQPPPAFYNRMYSAGSGGRSGRSMSASSLLHDAYMDGSHPLMRREAGDPSVSPAVATASSDTYLRHRETEMPYTASRMPVHMGRAMTPPAIQVVDVHHQRSPSLMTPNRSPAGGMEPYAHEASQQYSRRPLPPESPHGYGGYGQNKLGNGGVVSGSPLQLVSQGGRTRAHVAVNDSLRPPEAASTARRHGGGMNASQTLPDKLPTGAASATHYIDDLSGNRRSPYFADSLRSTQATSGSDNAGPTDACLAGLDASDLDREELSEQIETEMEKLMLDELYRLQLKPSLTPAEQRRYKAVRYELEFRRRMRSNSSGEYPANQTHPAAADQHETFTSRPTAVSPSVTREGDYSVRQQQRDRYFEEAERQYQMMAAREWHTRQKQQGMMHPEMRLAAQGKGNVVQQAENGVSSSSVSELTTSVDSQSRSIHNGARAQVEELPAAPIYEHGQKVPSDEPGTQPPKAQVQFDSAPPAVYLVDQLSNNERFMDLVTSASETNPVSGELENIIDAKLESPSPSSILVHHKNEAKYVYQNADETPRTQVIGGQEVYKDPRQERLKQLKPVCQQVEGEKLSFRDKMRLFAKEFNEPTPKPGVKSSSAQREIEMNLNISR